MRKWVALFASVCLLVVFSSSRASQIIIRNDAHKYDGRPVTVVGKIVSTQCTGEACFLNFFKGGERSFTAIILKQDFKKFLSSPETYYKNKMVRVKGMINEYKGKREIILKDPSQITIVEKSVNNKTFKKFLAHTEVKGASFLAKNINYHQQYSDDERRFLKSLIHLLGYQPNTTHSAWDKQTDQAVRAYQWNNNLAPDGRVGPKTLNCLADSVNSALTIDQDIKSKVRLRLYLLASKESNELNDQPFPILKLNISSPAVSHYYFSDETQVGDEVEWYDDKSGEYRSGEVESISGGEAKIYDYDTGEYHYVDKVLTTFKKCRFLPGVKVDDSE